MKPNLSCRLSKAQDTFLVLCNPESIIGYFDTDKLDKILYNLLSNAAKYNKEGGYIQVTLMYAEDRDFVRLHVKDNGSGISKDKQKSLFKRFYEGITGSSTPLVRASAFLW